MKKTMIFIIAALLILISVIPLIYAIFPQYQPAIGDFFGGLLQSATVLFNGFSSQFMQLPYWVAIAMGIAFIGGIMIDRWAWGFVLGLRKKLVSTAIQDTGLRYQQEPGYQQLPSSQPTTQPPPAETKEIEAK